MWLLQQRYGIGLALVLCFVGLAACGSDSEEGNRSASTPSPSPSPSPSSSAEAEAGGDDDFAATDDDRLSQGVRAIEPGQEPPPFTPSTRAAAGEQVQLRLIGRARDGDSIVRTRVSKVSNTVWEVSSQVGRGGDELTSRIELEGSQLELARFQYFCRDPEPSFCPVDVERDGDDVELRIAADEAAIFSLTFDAARNVVKPRLIELGAPGSGDPAALIRVSAAEVGATPPRLSDTTTAAVGDRVRVFVAAREGSPAGERLRIEVPRTTGTNIPVRVVARDGDVLESATVTSRDAISLGPLLYGCSLPPGTFCPAEVKRAGGSFVMTLETPRVPAVLLFDAVRP